MTDKAAPKRSKKIGLPAGSLVYIGEQKVEKVKISALYYDRDQLRVSEIYSLTDLTAIQKPSKSTWINITGLHEVETLRELGRLYEIDSLVMEDILNTDQRPKVEIHDSYLFIVLKTINYTAPQENLSIEQVSLILGKNFLLSFQESENTIFAPIYNRIKDATNRISKNGVDFIMYAMLDLIIDHYFLVMEKQSEKIQQLEDHVLSQSNQSVMHSIQKTKREMISLRQAVWPLREVLHNLLREDIRLIQKPIIPYLRDISDHVLQIIDTIELYRDLTSGILEVYLSSISNRLNEIMKVLTLIATIFIPLTFIAGIYGMNFDWMPELKWRWGYLGFWIISIMISLLLILFYKKKKWF
jgi:magnesium transporter